MIYVFFTADPHQLHLSITPELYLALTYLHEHTDLQRYLAKLNAKLSANQISKTIFKHLNSKLKPHERQYRTLKTLIASLSPTYARPEFSDCRANLEKTQALTVERFFTLSSTQTLNILSKKQRTAFIEQVSYLPNFAAFTSKKQANLIDNIIKRLKPTKAIKGKDIKQ